MRFLNHKTLHEFLNKINREFALSGQFYLIGETSLVYEGWRTWAETLDFTAEVPAAERKKFSEITQEFAKKMDVDILEAHPGDLIPLPDGFAGRAIRIDSQKLNRGGDNTSIKFYHFDPYSVAFRYIARGDEQDYQLVLIFLEKGWLAVEKMDALLSALLPHFSFNTIQQDPAEFRRKYKGLLQMWRSHSSI